MAYSNVLSQKSAKSGCQTRVRPTIAIGQRQNQEPPGYGKWVFIIDDHKNLGFLLFGGCHDILK